MNTICNLSSIRLREEWPHLLFVFLIVFVIYLWSAPQTVVLEDDGYFILAAYFNGTAHPPGYPLYTLLGHLSTWFPLGSVAFRVHALSALFGALSCGCLWWLTRMLTQGRIYAYIAALAFGFSKTFWSQAIIAEVYTLNVLLFLLLVIMALYWVRDYKVAYSGRLLGWMAFVYGLGLSNHWPLLVVSTPLLLTIMWAMWRVLLRQLPKALPWMLLGLVPYMWMVIRTQMDPIISFYGPIESWSDFWFYVSRQGYAESETSPSAGWWDKLQLIGFISRESLQQFGFTGLVFASIGFIRQWWIWPKSVCLGLTLGFLGNTLLLIGLLNFDYDLLHRNIFRVYPLIAYAVMALWLALGAYMLFRVITHHTHIIVNKGLVEVGLFVVIIGTVLMGNVADNYRANDNWAEVYGRKVLESLEPNSVLFISGDLDMSPVGYLNLVEKVRSDVTLYSAKGILLSNRLFYQLKNSEEERRKAIDEFILASQRPIYYIYGLPHDYGVEDFGLYWRINTELTSGIRSAVAIPEITEYFQRILAAGEPVDPWEAMHYRVLVTEHCRLSLNIMEFAGSDTVQAEQIQGWVDKICQTFHGKLTYIGLELRRQQPDWVLVKSLLAEAESLRDQSVLKSDPARLIYFQGEMLRRTGDFIGATQSYQRCLEIWQHPDNPAFGRLKEISTMYNTDTN